MSEYLDIIEERDGYRVRLEYDQDAEAPYDDGAVPILRLEAGGYNGYRIEAFNAQAMPFVDSAERLIWQGMDVFERYLKIFHGAVKVQGYNLGVTREYSYLAFDTAEWRAEVGAPDTLQDEDYLSEVRAWATGEVYGAIVERKVLSVTTRTDYATGEPLEPVEFDSWDEVESCWGYYGRDYAEQAARDLLTLNVLP